MILLKFLNLIEFELIEILNVIQCTIFTFTWIVCKCGCHVVGHVVVILILIVTIRIITIRIITNITIRIITIRILRSAFKTASIRIRNFYLLCFAFAPANAIPVKEWIKSVILENMVSFFFYIFIFIGNGFIWNYVYFIRANSFAFANTIFLNAIEVFTPKSPMLICSFANVA